MSGLVHLETQIRARMIDMHGGVQMRCGAGARTMSGKPALAPGIARDRAAGARMHMDAAEKIAVLAAMRRRHLAAIGEG